MAISQLGEKTKSLAYAMIYNNEITPEKPYTILVRRGSFNRFTVRLTLVQTDGKLRPPKVDERCKSLVRIIYRNQRDLYLSVNKKKNFQKEVEKLSHWRDALNLIHSGQPVTPELMASITEP